MCSISVKPTLSNLHTLNNGAISRIYGSSSSGMGGGLLPTVDNKEVQSVTSKMEVMFRCVLFDASALSPSLSRGVLSYYIHLHFILIYITYVRSTIIASSEDCSLSLHGTNWRIPYIITTCTRTPSHPLPSPHFLHFSYPF